MKQDFAQLYSELGLRPGCTLVELKRAYRRRVAELHPDRGPTQSPVLEQNLSLSELIALYTAAIHFHRQYGRLPGGLHVRSATASPIRSGTRRAVPQTMQPAHEEEPKLPFARTLIIAILLIALLLLLQTSWDRLAFNVSDESTRTPVGFVPQAAPEVVFAAETRGKDPISAAGDASAAGEDELVIAPTSPGKPESSTAP